MEGNTITAVELRSQLAADNDVRLVDVRSEAEFETAHIPGSYHVPLDTLREHRDEFRHVDGDVVLVCQSGNRASQAAEGLGRAGMTNVRILEGGIARWTMTGGQLNQGRQRWALERQVRLVAGSIVLVSILASIAVPAARFVAGFIGAGLTFAALSDTCAMGNLLSRLPYNRGTACDVGAVVRELTDGRTVTTAPQEATT